jgi:hypothetical protein
MTWYDRSKFVDAFRDNFPSSWSGVFVDARNHGKPAQNLGFFLKPELGASPSSLKRFFQPLVAVTALGLLLGLAAITTFHFIIFILASVLMYWIVTLIFGVQIDLNIP